MTPPSIPALSEPDAIALPSDVRDVLPVELELTVSHGVLKKSSLTFTEPIFPGNPSVNSAEALRRVMIKAGGTPQLLALNTNDGGLLSRSLENIAPQDALSVLLAEIGISSASPAPRLVQVVQEPPPIAANADEPFSPAGVAVPLLTEKRGENEDEQIPPEAEDGNRATGKEGDLPLFIERNSLWRAGDANTPSIRYQSTDRGEIYVQMGIMSGEVEQKPLDKPRLQIYRSDLAPGDTALRKMEGMIARSHVELGRLWGETCVSVSAGGKEFFSAPFAANEDPHHFLRDLLSREDCNNPDSVSLRIRTTAPQAAVSTWVARLHLGESPDDLTPGETLDEMLSFRGLDTRAIINETHVSLPGHQIDFSIRSLKGKTAGEALDEMLVMGDLLVPRPPRAETVPEPEPRIEKTHYPSDDALAPASSPSQKPGLFKQVLNGLPGFATSAATVWGAKAGIAALLTGVSPVALAPVVTTATALATGVFVGQSVAYLRSRWTKAEEDQGRKISLKEIFAGCAKGENIRREAKAYAQELRTASFWTSAVKKGGLAAALGTAVGWTPEIVQAASEKLSETQTGTALINTLTSTFNSVADVAGSTFSAAKSFVTESSAFKFASQYWPFGRSGSTASQPDRRLATGPIREMAPPPPPPEVVAPVESAIVPAAPLSPLEQVRALLAEKGVGQDRISRLLDRPDVTVAQRIDDVAVGLNNGIYGLPLDRDSALELFQTAKEMGNVKAAVDLDVATGKIAPPSPAVTSPVIPEASADRPAAALPLAPDVGDSPSSTPNAQPEEDSLTLSDGTVITRADAPAQVGNEAGRCVKDSQRNPLLWLCSVFRDTLAPGESVTIENKGVSVIPYINEGSEPVSTSDFLNAARVDSVNRTPLPAM